VSAVRSQNPYGWGGAIFTGIEVDDKGWRSDAKTHYVIMAPSHLLQTDVECGQWWRVEGTPKPNTIAVNGYRLTEITITPEAMELLRPSGEHVITLLAEGKAFEGIGLVKARRLWEHFGDDLYRVLDTADIERLAEVMPESMAQKLADAWRLWGDAFTLQWLQSKGFPVALGRKVLAFYGHEAARKIEDDPYRLISFAADWKTTDDLALATFGLATDDPRRLAGAVEEALYAGFDTGHTCLTENELTRRLRLLLNSNEPSLVANALAEAEASPLCHNGMRQLPPRKLV
jgi:exodeoxyribonuclease V alpha subunit